MKAQHWLLAFLTSLLLFTGGCHQFLPHIPSHNVEYANTALDVEQIQEIAKLVTVQLDSANSRTGVIVAKKRNFLQKEYYVLTVEHSSYRELDVVTHDGSKHTIKQEDTIVFPNTEIALIKFKSFKDYEVAILTNYDFHAYCNYCFDGSKSFTRSFVSGFPDPKQEDAFDEKKLLFTIGSLFNQIDSLILMSEWEEEYLTEGYDIAYTNITYRGMSGGGIFDTEGRLVGIHGRNTGNILEGGKRLILGYSLGISVSSFIKVSNQSEIHSLLRIENSSPDDLLEDISDEYLLSQLPQRGCTGAVDCLNYSNHWLRAGFYENALEATKPSVLGQPRFYLGWYIRGVTLAGLKRFHDALESFEQAVSLNSRFYPALFSKCLILFQLQDYESTISCFSKLDHVKPKSFASWHFMGLALYEMQRYEEAVQAFSKAIEFRVNPASLLNRGDAHRSLGNFQEAISDYSRVISMAPNFSKAYIKRGIAYDMIGSRNEALSDYDRAIQISPDNPTAYINRAGIRSQLDDKLGAINDYSKGLESELPPNIMVEVYSSRGRLYTEINAISDAVDDLIQASRIYIQLNKIEKSLEVLDLVIKISPTNADAYQNRGVSNARLKRYQEAIEDFDQAIRINPNLGLAYLNRGTTRFQTLQFMDVLRDGKSIGYVLWEDATNVANDLEKAAMLFRSQNDTLGQSRVRDEARKLDEILGEPEIIQDDRVRRIRRLLQELYK